MRIAPIMLAALASSTMTLVGLKLVTDTPATATSAFAEGNVAICDVPSLLEDLMQSDRYLPASEEKQAALKAEILDPIQNRAQELEGEFNAAQSAGDQAKMQQLQQEFMALQQQAQVAQQEFQTKIQEFISAQFKEAYNQIVEAAEAIGADMGFEYVASSTPPGEDFEDKSLADLLTGVLSRSYISFPDGVDITADVRDDLNLDAE